MLSLTGIVYSSNIPSLMLPGCGSRSAQSQHQSIANGNPDWTASLYSRWVIPVLHFLCCHCSNRISVLYTIVLNLVHLRWGTVYSWHLSVYNWRLNEKLSRWSLLSLFIRAFRTSVASMTHTAGHTILRGYCQKPNTETALCYRIVLLRSRNSASWLHNTSWLITPKLWSFRY